jgi:hypothetical protein
MIPVKGLPKLSTGNPEAINYLRLDARIAPRTELCWLCVLASSVRVSLQILDHLDAARGEACAESR